MIGRKPQRSRMIQAALTPPRDTSPSTTSSVLSDWDADDEDAMSTSEPDPAAGTASSQRMSIAISHHPQASGSSTHCATAARWPTLSEVLSNTAPPPWSLTAFMAYLSQNHCLETLEFTMDASRYRSHFDDMVASESTNVDSRNYVRRLWQRLVDAYIIRDGPREVNLPSNVRDRILSLSNDLEPPAPDSLDPAVKIVYELMEESVLVPFLNSAARSNTPAAATTTTTTTNTTNNTNTTNTTTTSREVTMSGASSYAEPWRESMENLHHHHHHGEDHHHRHRSRRGSSPSVATNRRNRSSPGASNPSGSGENLTEDSASLGGGSSPGREPMTPPTTPPTSDAGGASPRARHDLRPGGGGGGHDGTWKKMTGRLGWKKP